MATAVEMPRNDGSERHANRRFLWWLAAIALGAFLIRAAYAQTVGAFTGLTDPRYYHLQANLLAEGHGFADPYVRLLTGHIVAAATHPPLFPLVLSISSWLGGTSESAHRMLACLIGALAVGAIGLLGRRLGGPGAGGRSVGLMAAGIAALYPNLWILDANLFSEGLAILLVTVALLLAYQLRTNATTGRALTFGAVLGLAALTRPETVLLIPLLAAPIFFRNISLSWARRFALLGLTVLVFGVLLAPWIGRNLTGFDRPVTFSTNADTVLGVANCRQTYHGSDLLGWWSTQCSRKHSLLEDPSIHASILRRRGLDYAQAHAGRLAAVVVPARVARLFDLYHPVRTAQLEVPEGRPLDASKAGLVAYWLLVPFAVIGAISLHRRRADPLWPLLTPLAVAVLVAIYSYGNVRFRAIAEPVIVVLATLGLQAVWRAIASIRARRAAAT
jgi:4-amino-4-deoxy-L-arabinose transferase-like glycosyltransferase